MQDRTDGAVRNGAGSCGVPTPGELANQARRTTEASTTPNPTESDGVDALNDDATLACVGLDVDPAQRIARLVALYNDRLEMEALRGLLEEGDHLPETLELGGVQCTREDLARMLGVLEEQNTLIANFATLVLTDRPIKKDFSHHHLPRTRMELGQLVKAALADPERIAQFKDFTVIITVTDPDDPAMAGWREYFGPYDISEVTCEMVMADVRAVHPRAGDADWGLHSIKVCADGIEPIEFCLYRSLVLCAAGIVDDCSGAVEIQSAFSARTV